MEVMSISTFIVSRPGSSGYPIFSLRKFVNQESQSLRDSARFDSGPHDPWPVACEDLRQPLGNLRVDFADWPVRVVTTQSATRWDSPCWRRRYPEASAQANGMFAKRELATFMRTWCDARTTHARLRQHGRDHARCCTPSRGSFDCRPVDARTDSPSPCDVNTAHELGACRFDAWARFRGVSAAFLSLPARPRGSCSTTSEANSARRRRCPRSDGSTARSDCPVHVRSRAVSGSSFAWCAE